VLIIRNERVSESALDKTLGTPNKTEQANDDKIKQIPDSFIDEYTFEEKMHDLSFIHQNIQTGLLSKNKH
jgi:hypothetical protein